MANKSVGSSTQEESSKIDLGNQNFGEITKSYDPEFVAKHFNEKLNSFVTGHQTSELKLLPKAEQHALGVLEIERHCGTEVAKEVNENMQKLWELRDWVSAKLIKDGNNSEVFYLPDAQEEFLLFLHNSKLISDEYEEAEFAERRSQVVRNFFGVQAISLREKAEGVIELTEKDEKLLGKLTDQLFESFYKSLDDSGFSLEELKDFRAKGKIIFRSEPVTSVTDMYIYMIDPKSYERAFIGVDGMFSQATDYSWVQYASGWDKDEQKLGFSTVSHASEAQNANREATLQAIREKFQ